MASPPSLAQSAFVRLMSCIRLVQGRLTEHEQARGAVAQPITNPPPTFFVVRAHAAREQDDRDGAREAFEGALAHGLLELPRGPTWTMSLTWLQTSAPGSRTARARRACTTCWPPPRTS